MTNPGFGAKPRPSVGLLKAVPARHHLWLLKSLELAGLFNNCFHQYPPPMILFSLISTAKVKEN